MGELLVASFRRMAIFVLFAASCTSGAWGQQEPTDSITGLQPNRPVLPTMDPRNLGTALQLRDLKTRPPGEDTSVAGFVDSLQGDDAVIQVIVGRGRLLTLNRPLIDPANQSMPAIAVGDPTVLDFDLFPNSRMIRLLGKRVGVTDLSIITGDGQALHFEVQVVYDLQVASAYMQQLFPNSSITLRQMYEHVVVEGQAPNIDEVAQILQTLQAYLGSVQLPRTVKSQDSQGPEPAPPQASPEQTPDSGQAGEPPPSDLGALDEEKPDITAELPTPQIINLIRVPGVQQVMLQVRIAELNRTALRELGSDIFYRDSSGRVFGTKIAGALASLAGLGIGTSTTSFAVIPNGTVELFLKVLRSNRVLNVLAEPNLMAMHGQEASFLAGGEFPVPVPQSLTAGGSTITIEFKEFGVLLNFTPYIIDDDLIRLYVAPEVSTIDRTIGVTIEGTTVPGVNTRRAQTTVELRQGQTLALAGLLQLELAANTDRIPYLGDLPYIGPFFSNTSHQRVEKELIIMVTPYLVSPMEANQVGPLPGSEVSDPDDFEFYWLNRIEGRAECCPEFRPTTAWDRPLPFKRLQQLESEMVYGPYGFSK